VSTILVVLALVLIIVVDRLTMTSYP